MMGFVDLGFLVLFLVFFVVSVNNEMYREAGPMLLGLGYVLKNIIEKNKVVKREEKWFEFLEKMKLTALWEQFINQK